MMKIGRIPIADVSPVVSCGRWSARAVVGETLTVAATVFREGHDAVNADVVLYPPSGAPLLPVRLIEINHGLGRWETQVTFTEQGLWTYTIEAWADPVSTWRHNVEVKVAAGQGAEELANDLEEGALLLERAAKAMAEIPRKQVAAAAATLHAHDLPLDDRLAPALSPEVSALLDATPVRDLLTTSDTFEVWVDREQALFSAWYEFFPRSEGAVQDPLTGEWRSGSFRTATERLPAVAAMGFDVLYLPPVHPIGLAFRKGPNNTLTPSPGDPGSPWAIGSDEGGHDAIHPDLGTFADFDAFVAEAARHGLEIALDYALNASPDHPWAKDHPEWFTTRPDGTIAYAENPPKKYQDIYPINFDNDPDGIYAEALRIARLWIAHGVKIFRVDNPHTKPVAFWEWLIAEIKKTDPDVLFLAEAFTRPPMMHMLGKVGFTQSYTYFTWRNEKWELEEYLRELVASNDYMRPNFFVNTPDILPAVLQYGGPAAFSLRATLAAMLSPAWGVYAGYELYENEALKAGGEEYLNSEKFQLRPRDWARATRDGRTLAPHLTRLNAIRKAHPALHYLRNLVFHHADSAEIIAFSKRITRNGVDDTVLVVVNLDPHSVRATTLALDMPALGLDWDDTFTVRDELTGNVFSWGQRPYVQLDPFTQPAHILTVTSGPAPTPPTEEAP
jgi:starch synthase (maltosyl-transferring)